jgi:hypothetical protein
MAKPILPPKPDAATIAAQRANQRAIAERARRIAEEMKAAEGRISPDDRVLEQMREDARQTEMRRKMTEAYERIMRGSTSGMKKGGKIKKYSGGGSASKRADGCAVKGKTRGKFV